MLFPSKAKALELYTSRVGGIPEALNYGKAGILIEQKNPKQIIETVISLLNNDKLRTSLIKKGREWVISTFSWDILAKQITEIFRYSLTR